MADIPFPRGVRDLLPNEALFRNELIERIESVFRLFGYASIDTPSFESLQVLRAKNAIGSDVKLIYELKDEQLGLRYDNTVSLARYMAMHQELPMPFKRYYTGKIWRREEPQRLRYREVTQADADIVGGDKPKADADVIAVAATILDNIGLDYKICINDRGIMDKVLAKFGVAENLFMDVMRTIDKIDRSSEAEVSKALMDLNLESSVVDQIMAFTAVGGTNDEKLSYIDNLLGDGNATKYIRETLDLLGCYSIRGEIRIDFCIVRGLDYYTGIVFECKSKGETSASIGGGGRYDDLIGVFSSKKLPAVGVSLGIDRILEILDFSSSIEYTYANVFVANVNDGNYRYALKVANSLRANGIPTEMNMALRNLSNQFSYASAIRTKYAIIIGDEEERLGKLKLRNLVTGKEEIVYTDEAMKIIKGK
ncbi:MAG: histidine--tRNA ligase [Candidatus Micrarchaeaceae archaeon]